MQKYDPDKVEKKWQQYWEKNDTFSVDESDNKEKFYSLVEFPYPSGSGLHVGHPRSYTGMDIISRKKRMEGKNVLYPMGFDSFGLPAENYAIKVGRPPQEITEENIENFKQQLKSLGLSFDWSREVTTSEPEYYQWTQWIFLQLFKHGLAYKENEPINWCVDCKINLANEEVVDGVCERCDGEVEKRDVEQWMLSITDYADNLIDSLNEVDYIEKAKTQQRNWIGKSHGAKINFPIASLNYNLEVFTTRPDTIFGATYMVVAPEHDMIDDLKDKIKNWKEVKEYVDEAKKKSDLERTDLQDEKTGQKLIGPKAVNPATGKSIPIFVADYVLNDTGTGAIMAVPAHDERDYEFAQKYDLEIKKVVKGGEGEEPYTQEGISINSDFLNELKTEEAQEEIIDWLEENNLGQADVNYQLNDWVFSRQRYWGEPIPLVHCDSCEQNKPKALIIHGFEADGDSNWFPWMEKKLKEEGFEEVYRPSVSTNESPDIETWMEELKPYMEKLDEIDVIIGHSLGARAALYLLEKTEQEISHFYSVAGAIGEIDDRDWKKLEEKWPDSDVQSLKDFTSRDINWDKINDLVYSKNVILSEGDPFINKEMYDLPEGWHFRFWKDQGHFLQEESEELLQKFTQAKDNGWIPLPEEELPLELPELEDYEPSDKAGESPLSKVEEWVSTECPRCGSSATRETDVMPNWAGSSWYFLRYTDSNNQEKFASEENMKYWMPVDWYNGGMEHTTLHLLYSRFWNQFMYDAGHVPTKEPYQKRTSHGMILAEGGKKMSKSKGNVVNPNEVVDKYGADAVRTYIMFMGPFDQDAEWSEDGLKGVRRFLDRVWRLQDNIVEDMSEDEEETANEEVHKAVKKATEDIEEMGFNTAIAQMMECVNALNKLDGILKEHYKKLVKILSPFAPHICEEIWEEVFDEDPSISYSKWPEYREEYLQKGKIKIAVQINGEVRDEIEISADADEEKIRSKVMDREQVQKYVEDKNIKKFIYVEGNLVSIVV